MRRLVAAIVCVFAVSQGVASAQWHEAPMKIIVPFAAGGAVDQVARIVAANMPKDMTVIVENRSGSGGEIGVTAAAKAGADGKTVLLHTSSLVINPIVKGDSPEAEHMFEPLVRVGETKFVLVVPAKFPARTFTEFVAEAKKSKRLTYGSTGPGTTLQIGAEMLKEATGIAAVHVPYRGLNPAFTDLLAGNIDFMVTSVTGVLPHVKSGMLRPLATFSDKRADELPDVPTTAELGYADLKISNWYGLFITAQAPEDKRKELEATFMKVVQTPAVKERLEQAGVTGVEAGAEFKADIAQEFIAYRKIVTRLGISVK